MRMARSAAATQAHVQARAAAATQGLTRGGVGDLGGKGHGEDVVAAAVVREMQLMDTTRTLHVQALPMVGLGSAYVRTPTFHL